MKVCSTCKVEQDLSCFYALKASKDGLSPRCKACYANYYKANQERAKAAAKAYQQANRAHVLEKKAEYRHANRERRAEYDRAWRKSNAVTCRARRSARRALERNAGGRYTAADVASLLELQRCRCAACQKSLKTGYHIDHVIPLAKGGRNDRTNLQLLCPGCNLRKSKKDPIDFMQAMGFLL